MTLIASTYWAGPPFRFREPPGDAAVEPLVLRTRDHRDVAGLWWSPAAQSRPPRCALIALHPRVDFTRHYTFPALLEAGYGCLGLTSRSPNDDVDCVHEELVLDLAAAVAHLRDRGVERVILLGNSGGGSLAALYQSQALAEPSARLAETPSGASTGFASDSLAPADGMVYLAAHPGQGKVLGRCIDPAVVEEGEPLRSDPALDMYSPDNGFVVPARGAIPQVGGEGWSRSDGAFVERFRRAQDERVARLDALARALLDEGREASRALREAKEPAAKRELARRRAFQPVMVIYRTMANPDYVDERRDPSPRAYGSLLSDRPDLMNWQRLGFARTCTPRAWLSTWSSRSSQADMLRWLPAIATPSLMIHAGADREIHPAAQAAMTEALGADDQGADDQEVVTYDEAGHYFEPPLGETASPERDAMAARVIEWLRERFPT